MKRTNKGAQLPAESVERRASMERNSAAGRVVETQSSTQSQSGLARVRAAARQSRTERFSNLMHHIDVSLLWKAYEALNRKAASGIDGEDWSRYGDNLLDNLTRVHGRLHSGRYRAKPVKRVWINKNNGEKRPIGITCVEDKVVQQALVWVLESIYEVDFKGFSYGYRPGRSQHNALDALHMAITVKKVSYVFETDIKGCYDHIDQQWLMRFMEHRIADRRILKVLKQTLQAGVVEDGQWSSSENGIAQGAVISPLLANIYLHYSLDLWSHQWRTRHARGEVYLIRFADDLVACFQYREDAVEYERRLAQRLAVFSLHLHPQKTRVMEFGRFAESNARKRGGGKPATFDFLGFTHICSRRRSDGGFLLRRITIAKRQRAKLNDIKQWLRRYRLQPIAYQGRHLSAILRGAINYYGVPGNTPALCAFRSEICKAWLKSLRRRSQKAGKLTWSKMGRVIRQWIPSIKVVHPYPGQRLCV